MPARDREQIEDGGPERPAPVAAPAGPATPVARVLDMQRGMGNAAVARMMAARAGPVVARDPVDAGVPPIAGVPHPDHIDVVAPRAGDAADMDRAIGEYFSNEDWEAAARVLNDFNQAQIDTRVRGYGVGERAYLISAASVNGAAADRIRKVAEFENAIEFRHFDEAARAIDGFPDASRVEPRLNAGLGLYDLAWILQTAEHEGLPVILPKARPFATAHSAQLAVLADNAITTSDWRGAAVLLNGVVDADLSAHLASPPRTPAQLFDISRAADQIGVQRVHSALALQPTAGLIQTEGLDRTLRDQIAAADWPGVAATLGRYNDDNERRARLQWFHLDQVTALANHLRGIAGSTLYPLVEARRIEKLGQDYTAAVGASNWGLALPLLNAYNDTDLLPKAREIQTAKGAAGVTEAANLARVLWMGDDNNRIRRVLAFLPHEGHTGPAPAGGGMTSTGPAAAGSGVAVAGGTVNAYENAAGSNAADTGWFGFEYTGPQATSVGWIQFIGREAEKFDAAGKSLGFVDTTWDASGQSEQRRYSSTASPRWFVDTFGGDAPFYDAAATTTAGGGTVGARGGHSTGPNQTSMFDQPGLHTGVAADAFNTWFWEDDVDHVVMRAKFHDYLVQGNQVLYENSMIVEWRMPNAAARPAQTNKAGRGTATNRMQTIHFQALVRRFPTWGFYNHG